MINDELRPKRKAGRPRKEGIAPTIHAKKVPGLTGLQCQYLLDPESVDLGPKTWGCWKLDQTFCEIRTLVERGRVLGTPSMIERARKIVSDALSGGLPESESSRVQVDIAWKIMQAYPEPLTKKVIFKSWVAMDAKIIPPHKLNRILEEMENDKSAKRDVLPVDHVGHTKLGSPTNREPGSEEAMLEAELDKFDEGDGNGGE